MRRRFMNLGMLLLSACSTENPDRPPSIPAAAQEERIEQLENWGALRDSAVVSLETPAQLQQHENASVVTADGQRIPMMRFVLQVDLLMDFTCAACLETHSVVMDLLRSFQLSTRNVILFPLSGHPSAMRAAHAFECANRDGQGREMYKALFEGQDDLGTRPWSSYAHEAMVGDTTVFNQCMAGPPSARIQAGIDLGSRFKITNAPAVVIDGWLIHPPTRERVWDALERAATQRRRR